MEGWLRTKAPLHKPPGPTRTVLILFEIVKYQSASACTRIQNYIFLLPKSLLAPTTQTQKSIPQYLSQHHDALKHDRTVGTAPPKKVVKLGVLGGSGSSTTSLNCSWLLTICVEPLSIFWGSCYACFRVITFTIIAIIQRGG